MRTKKFFYNSVSTAINQVIIIASGFITPLVMLNYYGSEVNGLVTSVSQFIVYFNLVEVGLSGASIYALYKPLSEKNIKGINSIISASNKFYIKAGFIFLGLVISLAFLYPFFIATKVLDPVAICFLVIVLGLDRKSVV